MYFSRIELNRSGPAVARLLKSLSADDYRHHQIIWRLFQGARERDFLYRRKDAGHWPRYYTVSGREPQDSEGLWSIDTKPYAPSLQNGMTLTFSLRVNPVVARKSEDGKRQRHDVVMDRKKQIGFKDMAAADRPPLQSIIRDAGLAWLGSRAGKHGFSFQEDLVTVGGYEQHLSSKHAGAKPIRFSTLDFGGLLTVTDERIFKQTLFSGIGPAKGLGCGMLMVRRV